MILDKERQLLQSVKALLDGTAGSVESFLYNPQLITLARDYEENRGKRVVDVGLNLFVLISDIYHRENFHSDVLKIVIDPSSPHKEGDKYLLLFIAFLNALKESVDISPADYTNATVFREQGRVDLMIQGDGPKKNTIVIENKMNGAADMHRQLPRYLNYVKEQGGTCDAIVYLRLNTARYPDTTDWTPEEQEEIYAKLVCVTAYKDSTDDLVNGWINKCEKISTHIDARLILGQYGTLIQKLGGEIMNKPIMKQFFSMMLDADTFKTAQSLSSMWNDLILYRVEAIIDIFARDVAPFRKVDNWKDGNAYFTGLMWKSAHLGIDIEVDHDSYNLSLWDRNDREGIKGMVETALREIKCGDKYPVKGGAFRKTFAFPLEHDGMMSFVHALKQDLKALIPSKN